VIILILLYIILIGACILVAVRITDNVVEGWVIFISQIVLFIYVISFTVLWIYAYVLVYKNQQNLKKNKFMKKKNKGKFAMTNESRYKLAFYGMFPVQFLAMISSLIFGFLTNRFFANYDNAVIYLTLCLVNRLFETTTIVLGCISIVEHPFVTFKNFLCC